MRWRFSLINPAQRIEAIIDRASKIMAIIASIGLTAMMLLTTADVIGRYFFSKPIWGTYELVSLLLIFAGTWGWGYCQKEKGHVSVTLLVDRFPKRLRMFFKSLTNLIGFAGFSLICWRIWEKALHYIALGNSGLTQTLEIPYYPFMLALMISSAMMALVVMTDLIHSLTGLVRK